MQRTDTYFRISRTIVHRIFGLTVSATIASVLITATIIYFAGVTYPAPLMLTIAALCPVVVTPPAAWFLYRRAREIDAAHQELQDAHRRLFDVHAKLQASHKKLEHKARHDMMTGLANREAFIERLQLMRRLSDRGYLLMIDADLFKRINDEYGHDAGDRVLSAVATAISGAIRSEDFGARIGGEEFAIILRETSFDDAAMVAERIRTRIEGMSTLTARGDRLQVTVSIGGAAFATRWQVNEVMRAADKMLYQAKNSGRNKVCISSTAERAA